MAGPFPLGLMRLCSTSCLILAWAVRLGMDSTSAASEEVIWPIVARKSRSLSSSLSRWI